MRQRTSPKDGLKKRGSDLADTDTRSTDHDARVIEKCATPDIPEEYKEWIHLFQEVADADALLEHQDQDHEITLQEGKQLTFNPIYRLLEKELGTL